SVPDFVFRGRPLSLLVASAFPAGVFALFSNQKLEAATYMKPEFTTMKKIRTSLIFYQESNSFGFLIKLLLSQLC
ncbi:hypothetical protein MOF27_15030, partial [Priestia megaterium]|uniref:hypothetical protein n=1 Tax=Priestia megaterium TaxID=1404 RepID=UPI0022816002